MRTLIKSINIIIVLELVNKISDVKKNYKYANKIETVLHPSFPNLILTHVCLNYVLRERIISA